MAVKSQCLVKQTHVSPFNNIAGLHLSHSLVPYTVFLCIHQVCLEDYSPAVCDDLYASKNSDALDAVQSRSSYWVLVSTFTLALSSIVTAQFLGSWSDTYGRKIPMLLPPLGKMKESSVALCQGFTAQTDCWVNKGSLPTRGSKVHCNKDEHCCHTHT